MKLWPDKYNPFKYIDDRIRMWVIRDICYLVFFFSMFMLVSNLPDVAGTRIFFQLAFGLLAVAYYLKVYDDMFIILGTPELRYDADELGIVIGLIFCLLFGFGLLTVCVLFYLLYSGPKYKKWVLEREQLFEKQLNDLFDSLSAGNIPASVRLIDEMAKLNNYRAVEPLALLMNDPDRSIRSHVTEALAVLNSKAARRKMGRPSVVAAAQTDKK